MKARQLEGKSANPLSAGFIIPSTWRFPC
jgi:hypothetical protein